jgi:DNA mismatch repair protein MSH6
MLLTGPNMGGKSTLLRAACCAVILAQMGCPVPAESAVISITDRIFTRLGARSLIASAYPRFMNPFGINISQENAT